LFLVSFSNRSEVERKNKRFLIDIDTNNKSIAIILPRLLNESVAMVEKPLSSRYRENRKKRLEGSVGKINHVQLDLLTCMVHFNLMVNFYSSHLSF
jgi:hypothetical protein